MHHWASNSRVTPTLIRGIFVAGALALLLAAAFGTFYGLVVYALACDENCTQRSWEAIVQLPLGFGGLVAAALMTYQTARGRWRQAAFALLGVVALYAAWAVLLDAAVHGWGRGPVPF